MQAKIRLLDSETHRIGSADEVTQRFVVESNRDGQPRTLHVELLLKRFGFSYVRESQWQVDRVTVRVNK